MKTRHELLLSFCSKDSLRRNLTQPFFWKNFTCATDGHKLIALPSTPEDVYEITTLDMSAVIPPIETGFRVKISDLISALNSVPMIDEVNDNECKNCDGTGEVNCSCFECGDDHKINCEDCQGSGVLGEPTLTGKKIPNVSTCFLLDKSHFAYEHMRTFIDALNELNVESVLCTTNTGLLRGHKFDLGNDRFILLMPMRSDHEKRTHIPVPVYSTS